MNDAGERAMKFGSDYHGIFAKEEEQHEAVLQTVEEHRRMNRFPRKKIIKLYMFIYNFICLLSSFIKKVLLINF